MRLLLQQYGAYESQNITTTNIDTWGEMTPGAAVFGVAALIIIFIFFLVMSCITRCRFNRDLQQNLVTLPPRELKIEDLCPLPPVHTPPVLILQPDDTMTLAVIQEGSEEEEQEDEKDMEKQQQQQQVDCENPILVDDDGGGASSSPRQQK